MASRSILEDVASLQNHLPGWYGRTFAFDVETTGLNYSHHELLGLALTFDGNESYYIVLKHSTDEEGYPVREFISPKDFRNNLIGLFAQTDVEMIAHHKKFDGHFLTRYGVPVRGRVADTMLAAQLLDENRSISLKELAPTQLGMNLDQYKELIEYPGFPKDSILGVPLHKAAIYAMMDTEATLGLYRHFAIPLAEEGMDTILYEKWMPQSDTLERMEARGIALDLDMVRTVRVEYEKKAQEHEHALWVEGMTMILSRYGFGEIPAGYLRMATQEEIESSYEHPDYNEFTRFLDVQDAGHIPMVKPTPRSAWRVPDFKVGSNKHLGDLLYGHLKLEPPKEMRLKKNADGSDSVNKETLEIMGFYLAEKAPPALKHIIEYRKATKFISTYLDRFLSDADPSDNDCIRTTFNQAGTDTGRLSSNGPNLQNIPSRGDEGKIARRMFVARRKENKVLVVGDLSQAELRLLAHYSQDAALMKAFEEGQDLHVLTGSGFARMEYEDLLERYLADDPWAKAQRQIGKTGNFALTYGMGAPKFKRYLLVNNGLDIPIEQSAEWIQGYNDRYAGATLWKKRVMAYAKRHGYVMTFSGRKRRLPDVWSDDKYTAMRAERQAVNAVIQGGVGDILTEVMPILDQAIAPLGGYLLLQVHDELVAEAPESTAPIVAQLFTTITEGIINPRLRVPQSMEAHIGYNWGDAKG